MASGVTTGSSGSGFVLELSETDEETEVVFEPLSDVTFSGVVSDFLEVVTVFLEVTGSDLSDEVDELTGFAVSEVSAFVVVVTTGEKSSEES